MHLFGGICKNPQARPIGRLRLCVVILIPGAIIAVYLGFRPVGKLFVEVYAAFIEGKSQSSGSAGQVVFADLWGNSL